MRVRFVRRGVVEVVVIGVVVVVVVVVLLFVALVAVVVCFVSVVVCYAMCGFLLLVRCVFLLFFFVVL